MAVAAQHPKPSPLGASSARKTVQWTVFSEMGTVVPQRVAALALTGEVALLEKAQNQAVPRGETTSSDPARAGPPSPEGEGFRVRGSRYSLNHLIT